MRRLFYTAILLALAAPLSARSGHAHARAATPEPDALRSAERSGSAPSAATDKHFDLAVADTGAQGEAASKPRAAGDTESKGTSSTRDTADDQRAGQGDTDRK